VFHFGGEYGLVQILKVGRSIFKPNFEASTLEERISVNKIFVSETTLSGNESDYVLDCISSNWISSIGKYIQLFEDAFAQYCGTKYAIATNNGTAALHLALLALDLKPGDEVIVPAITYIATANAVSYCGATPVFVDVMPNNLNIDPDQIRLKITRHTVGIIPVHLYGQPALMMEIQKIAEEHNLWIVEDAAEAHGAEINGKKVGSLGAAGVFSFYGNKIMTTGEGGMVTTNDDALIKKMRLFWGQGMDPQRRYWFPVIGYNYRMTNIQAALGLAQLEKIEEALSDRQRVAHHYFELLSPLKELVEVSEPSEDSNHVFWLFNIFIKNATREERDLVIREMDAQGIETRPIFFPLHLLPPYQNQESFPTAEEWYVRGISLPTHRNLSLSDQIRVVAALEHAVKKVVKGEKHAEK
jgi:perosamine synthetase